MGIILLLKMETVFVRGVADATKHKRVFRDIVVVNLPSRGQETIKDLRFLDSV